MENIQDIKFSVEPKLAENGIKVRVAIFSVSEVTKRRSKEFQKAIDAVIEKLNIAEMLKSPIFKEYKKFYKAVEMDGLPPAEHLLKLIEKSGMLPNINKVVDCYNVVSAETMLSIGAHDLAHINGNIQFRYTDGTEKYTPLGKNETEKVAKGEYACLDDEKILCRMDLKQCDETKVGENTKNFIVYVQGNSATSEEYVLEGLQKVCNNMEIFCKATYRII
jgi:DNA/RNA-binding domain of Phe-tRNA-synthetase-like protein